MSRDLTFLKDPTSPAGEAIESTDPRLIALTDLIEERRWSDAGDRAAELLQEGVLDVRVVTCYLHAAFVEGGFSALQELLDTVDVLLGDRLSVLGPAKKKDDQIDRRMAWMLETISDSVTYHQSKLTDEWDAWNAGVTVGTFEGAHASASRLGHRLTDGPWQSAARSCTRLGNWLANRVDELTRAPRRKDEQPAVVVAAKQTDGAAEASAPSAATTRRRRGNESEDPLSPKIVRVELGVSSRFLELTAKLKAFERLVEMGQLEKAAVVSDDIRAMIDAFDPRAYFPEVFGRFSGLVSKNIDELSTHWEHRDSVKWKAMMQFYRVDLRGFVER